MIEKEKELIREYFDDTADEYVSACNTKKYDSVRSYILTSRKKYILDMFDLKGGRVLDIGCGPAVFTEELLSRHCESWGIDISNVMVERANKIMRHKGFNDNFYFSTGDIEKLDFPDSFFDFVLCVGVLEYLKDDLTALSEIKRVLKNKGELIVTVPNLASPFALFDKAALIIFKFFLNIAVSLLGLFKIKIKIPYAKFSFRSDIIDKYYLPWSINKKLRQKGFEIKETSFHAFRIAALNRFSPRFALLFVKKLEFLRNSPLNWWGTNYIVKASKK